MLLSPASSAGFCLVLQYFDFPPTYFVVLSLFKLIGVITPSAGTQRNLPAQMSARSPSGPVMAASLRSVLPRTYGTAPSLVPNFRISIGIGEKRQFCWKYICRGMKQVRGKTRFWGLDTQWSVASGRWSVGSFRLSAGRDRRPVTGDREGKSPPNVAQNAT
jgi:hypothetical protein